MTTLYLTVFICGLHRTLTAQGSNKGKRVVVFPSPFLCHSQSVQPVLTQCVTLCEALCQGQPGDTQRRKPSLQEAVFMDPLLCLSLLVFPCLLCKITALGPKQNHCSCFIPKGKHSIGCLSLQTALKINF